jgi:hypothetical protein
MIYVVTVDSRGFSADWIDNLIVSSHTAWEAKDKAEEFILEEHPTREILSSEAYSLYIPDEAKVLGRLRNTDEE